MSLRGNSLTILWYQYFIYHLIHCQNIESEKLKKIMLDQCRFEYRNNQTELMKIDYFDMYCSNENILNWYTKDAFLYRLLNKAFRTRKYKFYLSISIFYKKFI